jgi:hypothetical protein
MDSERGCATKDDEGQVFAYRKPLSLLVADVLAFEQTDYACDLREVAAAQVGSYRRPAWRRKYSDCMRDAARPACTACFEGSVAFGSMLA